MKVLAINTVGAACEAAVVTAGGEHVVSEPMARGHDARIAPVVEQVMRESGLNWREIDRIGVITGPGSFTGIRVGVAFARGLGLALQKPVAGVTALEALGAHKGVVLAMLPAQRRPPERTWWTQVLSEGRGVESPMELDEAQLIDLSRTVQGTAGQSPPTGLEPDFHVSSPSALIAARLCEEIDLRTAPAIPVYVRAPDAAPMKAPFREPSD